MDTRNPEEYDRNAIRRTISLTILLIVMDLSGFAGAIDQGELAEEKDTRETHSGLNMPGFQSGLANLSKTLDIDYEGRNTCAVLDDASVWCWGSNDNYALASNTNDPSSTPNEVYRPSNWINQTISISMGGEHHCELLQNGSVNCWGTAMPAGASTPTGSATFSLAVPTPVEGLQGDAVLVESGKSHSCAILESGAVQCWGYNYYGELGLGYRCVIGSEGNCSHGSANFIEYPEYMVLPSGRTAVGLNLWDYNTCVILDDSSYVCTGTGFDNRATPLYVNGSYKITAADDWNALSNTGELLYLTYGSSSTISHFSGAGIYSRSTDNSTYQFSELVRSDIRILDGSSSSSSSQDYRRGCFIQNNASLTCGENHPYSSDADTFRGYLSRAWITTPNSTSPSAVISKTHMTCMALDDGSIQCWGFNGGGNIGDGSTCVYGTSDPTGCTSGNYVISPRTVLLPTGRHLSLGELDSDGDGISVLVDRCTDGAVGWLSNSSSDYDRDGCRDSDEDDDDDGDGYNDSVDSYPLNELFHHNLTMDQGFILGARYENTTISSLGTPAGNYISESESETYRAISSPQYYYKITTDNKLEFHENVVTHNWDSNASVLAVSSYYTVCVILDNGELRCWGDNSYGAVGNSNTGNSVDVLQSSNVSFPVNYQPIQISSTLYGTCSVLENGEVYCWGRNYDSRSIGADFSCSSSSYANGCDGNYNVNHPTIPVILPSGSSASSVYIYSGYSNRKCVVLGDGNAVCWGENDYGQLGNGNIASIYAGSAPELVYLPSGISPQIETLALAQSSTCGLWSNGSIYCWGLNNYGQLGDGTVCEGGDFENNCNGNSAKPIIYEPVIMPENVSAIALWITTSSSYEKYCSLMTTGGVWCWGNGINSNNGTGAYVDLNGFVQPGNRDWDSDGIYNTEDNCAAGAQGWTSTSSNDFDSDGCIDATEDDDDDGDSYSDSTEIACGTDPLNGSDVPLDPDNDGICNAFDDDDDNDGVLDVNDEFPNDPYGFVQLSLGDGFQSGQPQDNATLGNSGETTCAILSDETLRCWGQNGQGQVGDGTRGTQRYTPTNVSLPAGKTPVSISTSGTYGDTICAVMEDGSLYCWGDNYYGEVGVGINCASGSYINGCNGASGRSSPSLVQLPTDRTATAVSAGNHHTCAILDDGSVWCWGRNQYGELGVGNSSSSGDWRYSPNAVMMPSGVTAVGLSLGDGHSCMVVSDGRIFCWGHNGNRALGDGTNTDRNMPTQVSGTASYVSISSGPEFNCAITNLGTVQCWGLNNRQQLGLGYSGSYTYSTPQNTALPAGIQASSLALGSEHACAVMETMSVYCWGYDDYGQLNTAYECENDNTNGCSGDYRSTPAPTQLPTGRGGVAVIAGYYYTCVFINNGGVYCFGYNSNGQLGNGTFSYSPETTYVDMPVGISPQTNDRDLDHDGVFNNEDLCMEGETGWTSNNTTDNDGDGCQDSSEDLDDDNDFLNDTDEAIAGTNSTNPDTDGDGYLDGLDDFPLDGSEWLDTDGDGIGNNADTDDDGDGWSDSAEYYCLTDPLNGTDIPSDFDGDGNCDYTDNDDDNDGTYDSQDDFPLDGSADTDTDGDGMPDSLNPNPPTQNLVGHWSLDDIFGPIIDSSGYHHNATAHGTPTYNATGRFGNAIDFDGTDDYFDAGSSIVGIINNSGEFTLSVWVNTTSSGSLQIINAGIGNSWFGSLMILSIEDGNARVAVPATDMNYPEIFSSYDINDGQWHLITGTFVSSGNQSVLKLYIDGSLDATLSDFTWDTRGLNHQNMYNGDFYIGTENKNTPSGLFYSGVLDEIRVYDRALTTAEVSALYTSLIEDLDDDNDGWSDEDEIACGYNTLSNSSTPTDTDGDTVCDDLDVFPNDPNEWEDSDGDGVGDNGDAFPNDANETSDFDGDGIGDNADTDDDADGWSDSDELQCLTDPLNQTSFPGDIDADGICDALELDLDNDGWTNANESVCGTDFNDVNSVPLDTDGDMICDIMDFDDDGDLVNDVDDAFPLDPLEWSDFDGDGVGDNTDPDDDNDGCMDLTDDLPFDATECDDTDGDGIGNNADDDDDGDNLTDDEDPFPLDAAATVDTDGDGLPDFLNGNSTTGLTADPDDDNDGWNDTDDAFPLDDTEWLDTDGDGIGNNADLNDDGDGCFDTEDAFPLDPSECYDTDSDGVGNNADPDDDNDGWLDTTESICGTSDPLDANSVPDDNDGDGVCDLLDYDDDNDSYIDGSDAFPFDPCAAVDTDGDGDPDWIVLNCNTTLTEDLDDDNDGYLDTNDTFPQDASEWTDFDGDGYGDNYDTDDDGDQVPDEWDEFPYNSTEWADADDDGIGDNADPDDDNDGVDDDDDDFPNDAAATTDTDGDGMPDTIDSNVTTTLTEDQDDDGDGVLDIYDWAPLDPTEWVDTDGDGTGDNADADDDGDGWSDNDEYLCGTNHLDANDIPPDSDGDGICDDEDDSDTSTLSGKIRFFMTSPVTVWMALVGVLCALVIGATGSALRSHREKRLLIQQTIDHVDSLRGHAEYGMMEFADVEIPVPIREPAVESRADVVQKYLNRGYSPEVANILADDELKNR